MSSIIITSEPCEGFLTNTKQKWVKLFIELVSFIYVKSGHSNDIYHYMNKLTSPSYKWIPNHVIKTEKCGHTASPDVKYLMHYFLPTHYWDFLSCGKGSLYIDNLLPCVYALSYIRILLN